jgi:3-oxoacyl-[acyl-carrier protein] reductase
LYFQSATCRGQEGKDEIMDTQLDGKCVLITGASGGIGQVCARHFAAENARLVLHYHQNAAPVEALCHELEDRCTAVGADLRDEQQVEAMFAGAIAAAGRIDALVVNAGIWPPDAIPIHDMTLAQWRDTIESDLASAFLTCRAFFRHLAADRRTHASVVLIASTAALFGEAGHCDYAAAKAGMAYGLTLSLKNEIVQLAPRGRVNCICPGWTVTPMTSEQTHDQAEVQRVTSTMALRKIAGADDMSSAVVFLTSDRLAGHITGAILPVAGGMEGRLLHDPDTPLPFGNP